MTKFTGHTCTVLCNSLPVVMDKVVVVVLKFPNKKKTTTGTDSELDLLYRFLGNNFIPCHLLSLLQKLFSILIIV